MEAENPHNNAWWRSGMQWILLTIPLGVYFLPSFQTTFQEDFVVLSIFFYLLLRTFNPERFLIPGDKQPILTVFCLGILYGIGWFGLLRGYEDIYQQWMILYPIPLLLSLTFHPRISQSYSFIYRILLYTTWILSLFLPLMAGFLLWAVDGDQRNNIPAAIPSIVPSLMIFPILACVALVAGRSLPFRHGRSHIPILILAGMGMGGVWSNNFTTWRIWYQAGVLERAWTPFKYDDPTDIQRAERKPFDAANLYNQVLDRLSYKGDIPRLLNWPLFMRYRMAEQFMRKKKPESCAWILPPGEVSAPSHIELLRNLWHQEFLWTMPDEEPNYPQHGQIWIDAEFNPQNSLFYMMDQWGRVCSIRENRIWIEWKSEDIFNDAVDLEIRDNNFIVLRKNGEVLSSQPIELFKEKPTFPPGHEGAVDLEFFRDGKAAVVVNLYGDMFVWGTPPSTFPSYIKLRFDVPVVADMELEPTGSGYYLMDISGAIHANHISGRPSYPYTSPPVPQALIPYWAHQNMAIDLELDPQGRGMYIYNRQGEMFTLAAVPYRETYRPPKIFPYRGAALVFDSEGNLNALESNGQIVKIP